MENPKWKYPMSLSVTTGASWLLSRTCAVRLTSNIHCGRNVDTCDTNANRDLTRNTFLILKTYHVIQPSGSRTSLRDQCFFCIVHTLWSFVNRSALVPLQSVAIPETVLACLLLRHYKQLSSGLHTLFSQSYSPAHACALFCICRANFNHIEHVTQV